ncbi:hypothetical protein E2C01_084543 [Portunus trituberculatus]|uniref:Uncharacterized protein n=1 Tax=Portunus trituberculatus TaxID=210409 RepID=A0A5B7J4H1_PORTR|nr:hypothetical protein [Portunus trituberculatus]
MGLHGDTWASLVYVYLRGPSRVRHGLIRAPAGPRWPGSPGREGSPRRPDGEEGEADETYGRYTYVDRRVTGNSKKEEKLMIET